MDNEQDYISQMVEDTFQDVESEESNILEFSLTNENSEIEQLSFDFESFKGRYDAQRSCVCLELGDNSVELPTNWGPFRLYDFNQDSFAISIEKHEDVDLLLEILSIEMGEEVESIFLIFEGEEVHFKINQTHISSIAA